MVASKSTKKKGHLGRLQYGCSASDFSGCSLGMSIDTKPSGLTGMLGLAAQVDRPPLQPQVGTTTPRLRVPTVPAVPRRRRRGRYGDRSRAASRCPRRRLHYSAAATCDRAA